MIAIPDVSRETEERLRLYLCLLEKWNPRINLVAPDTLADAWTRHFSDSAQLFGLADGANKWLDIGSGGGFPGLVCAVLAQEAAPQTSFILIESDGRKCAFLRSVIRELDLSASVLNERIETAEPQDADVVSARALAPLPGLLQYAERHLNSRGVALFQKGRNWQSEVQIARETCHFQCEAIQSRTEEGAAILKITDIAHV